ncbi:hypothetical protein H9Q69_009830 [Fusarium xylarioides]|uniref:C2H2-type domain-containing protein n=1 Tax=Fusarium xylarioides TaxID=221167 RepID=A0A9P7L0L4_9HYPO|nr:hypothetical protein H9Q70_005613 [Fusarium xylarioides]KAG5759595.1 hypothetical protein H9Q72_012278 [Fusarium xylarioides]KAG5780510.1 hypothetical protein H9Q73_005851 [Fusarium xylarioides]KAG5791106.1 hypothetical protein H9Q69_009830 [Fusarium xylarioides]KAG5807026.1 hypothetical protein H9Q71_008392 [Fusarium xylarioides]
MSPPLPQITITSPTGDQVSVLLFPAPAPKSAAVPPWEFFSDQIAEPEPSSAPTTTFAENEALQRREDYAYAHLPDTLAEFKTKTVPADEFAAWQCRICGKNHKQSSQLKVHIGLYKAKGKKTLRCAAAQKLLSEAGVVWDPNSVDVEPDAESEAEDLAVKPAKKKKRAI